MKCEVLVQWCDTFKTFKDYTQHLFVHKQHPWFCSYIWVTFANITVSPPLSSYAKLRTFVFSMHCIYAYLPPIPVTVILLDVAEDGLVLATVQVYSPPVVTVRVWV